MLDQFGRFADREIVAERVDVDRRGPEIVGARFKNERPPVNGLDNPAACRTCVALVRQASKVRLSLQPTGFHITLLLSIRYSSA